MKLHLPKLLLTAVLAAVAMAPSVHAASAWGGEADKTTAWFEIGDAFLESISAYDKDGYGAYQIKSNANTKREVNVLTLAADKTTTFMHRWQSVTDIDLEVKTLSFGANGNGSGDIVVNQNQKLVINELANGSCFAGLTNYGTMSIGTESSITTFSKTITNAGTLTLNGTIVANGTFDLAEEGSVTYSYGEQEGFKSVSSPVYYLYKRENDSAILTIADGSGYTVNRDTAGNVESVTISGEDYTEDFFRINGSNLNETDLLSSAESVTSSTKYALMSGSLTVADNISSDRLSYTGGTLIIGSNELTISGNDSEENGNLLKNTTGTGKVHITADTELQQQEITQATGQLSITNGANLTVGNTDLNNSSADDRATKGASIASFTSMLLDNGSITVNNPKATINNLTVGASGGTINVFDVANDNVEYAVKLTGSTTLNGTLTLDHTWNALVDFAKLAGSGNVQISSTSTKNELMEVTIREKDTNFTGKINVTKAKKLKLNIAQDLDLTVNCSGSIGSLDITNIKSGNTVTMTGVTGCMMYGTTNATVELSNTGNSAALSINNGYSNQSVVFAGKVKDGNQAGNIVMSAMGDVTNITLQFSGDVSQWTGGMVIAENGGSQNITYTGNATTINNSVIAAAPGQTDKSTTLTFEHTTGATVNSTITNNYWNRTGTLNMVVSNTHEKGTTFNGAVTVNSLTVSEGTLATIKGTTTTGTLTTNGLVNVSGTGSLTYADTTKVEAASSTQDATLTGTTINSAKVTFSGAGGVTESRVITNSTIDNRNTGLATVKLGDQNAAILATNGNINAVNTIEAVIDAVTIGAGMTVGLYSGTEASEDAEGTLTTCSLTVGGIGATLNANLVLSSGATVTMAKALTMGSTLTLSEGMTLDGAMLTSVTGLREGETVDLFKSVDSLILGDATYDANNALAEGTVSLKQYFTNVTNEDIYLAFNNGNVFAGIMSIPEPTTATLSLLALAGLAARRRRK